ncbi:transporter, NRAMP family protein [Psychromonas ingrahamii 37]|uniref:Transporter, NRAMP family protein n=1 Tax=Psychromonas ingrahamii (strain DSM 17664 / CCUG 51855 / 37) TaxID=357804 RepID=A1SVI9_PSYIN|nr:divalent metal cation transporter [Psychromonas ingrahamii]ABM03504.1 transporter, NRAMP family protein [Psychromonas ingrahamii 37]
MENSATLDTPHKSKLSHLLQSLGPGIMMATAAVGGSHLVASTKAGAIFGWQLALLILLVNFLKYPFFRAGVTYTMGTGQSLIAGYADMGKGYLWLFTLLTAMSAVINTAALTIFSASLLGIFLPFDLSLPVLSAIVIIACLAILLRGHFNALEGLAKIIMGVLTVTTLIAVVVAANQVQAVPADFNPPSAWSIASIGFIVIMMGWMPAPIEISCLTSLWLKRQCKEIKVTNQSALFDFNVGYIITALLAIAFLALGALVLHGHTDSLEKSGIAFSHQLVGMYASTIGEWSKMLIAVIAFGCIFGSTITVIDGYARALAEAKALLQHSNDEPRHNSWMLLISACAMAVILFFVSSLMAMLNFAMVLAFMTTPIFALLNYKLVNGSNLPVGLALTKKMKVLSWLGLTYLFGFLALFIWWKWLM